MLDAGVSLGKWGGILLAVVLSVLAVVAYFYGIPWLIDDDAPTANDTPATPMQADVEAMLDTLGELEQTIGEQHHAARIAQRTAEQELTELHQAEQEFFSILTTLRNASQNSTATTVTLFGETFAVGDLSGLWTQWEREWEALTTLIAAREQTVQTRAEIVATMEASLQRVATDREALTTAWNDYRETQAAAESGESPPATEWDEDALLDLLTTIHRRNGTYEPVIDTTTLDDANAGTVRTVLSLTPEARFRDMLPAYQR